MPLCKYPSQITVSSFDFEVGDNGGNEFYADDLTEVAPKFVKAED